MNAYCVRLFKKIYIYISKYGLADTLASNMFSLRLREGMKHGESGLGIQNKTIQLRITRTVHMLEMV